MELTDSHEMKDWLHELFDKISQDEFGLDYIRAALQKHIKSFPYLFADLDSDAKHFATAQDLLTFMSRYKVKASLEYSHWLVRLYSLRNDNQLTEEDIRNMISPIVVSYEEKGDTQLGAYGMAVLFSSLLEKEIELIKKLCSMADLLLNKEMSLRSTFEALNNKNDINEASMSKFFSDAYNETLPNDIATLIIHRLDRNRDKLISYTDLTDSLHIYGSFLAEQKLAKPLAEEKLISKLLQTLSNSEEECDNKVSEKKLPKPKELCGKSNCAKMLIKKKLLHVDADERAVKLFKELIDKSNSLEKVKQELAQRIDFTIDNAWRCLCPENEERIHEANLIKKLQKLGIKEVTGVSELVKSMGSTNRNYLFKSDFEEKILLPKSETHKKILLSRERTGKKNTRMKAPSEMKEETKRVLGQLLLLTIEHFNDIKHTKIELKKLNFYTISKDQVLNMINTDIKKEEVDIMFQNLLTFAI